MSEHDTVELAARLAAQPQPVCAELTPFELVDADLAAGFVAMRFDAQPLFANHFGNIQGGFAVALIDALVSVASYALLGRWCPTVEIKSSFVAPARLGECRGEARVIRAGATLVFLESRLWGGDGELAVHATATVSVRDASA